MKKRIQWYNIIGYALCILLSLGLGYISTFGGEFDDFIQKLGMNLIPLLLTLLVLYTTLSMHLISELRKLQENKPGKNISKVIYSMKRSIIVEVIIILVAFIVLVCRNFIIFYLAEFKGYIQIGSNVIITFSFFYFLWIIIDATMGLYALVIDNANNK